ncbi:hypothetical protein ACTSKR_11525 [Chitinibacteraceae bacterium HSL-7]
MEQLIKDGENQAVRAFLNFYCGDEPHEYGRLRWHLRQSGFEDAWPDWAAARSSSAHITTAEAQDWLRYLFALELPIPIESTFSGSLCELNEETRNAIEGASNQGKRACIDPSTGSPVFFSIEGDQEAWMAEEMRVYRDAERWAQVLNVVGADTMFGHQMFVLRTLAPVTDLMQGSVAEHFTKAIDAKMQKVT